jgi:ferric-dicitrate binding protein FerR (iron transport regulator)
MRNRIAIAAVILGLAAFAAFAEGTPESTGYSASVAYIEGQAKIDGKAANIGDTVPLGSTVVTDAQSLCEIRFNGKNAIRLAESTTFVFNPANLQRGSELKQGALIMVLKNLTVGADGAGFKLRTPSAVADVRGTSFFVKAVDASTTYVCCCNGALHVQDYAGGTPTNIEAPHHKAYVFQTKAAGIGVTDSTLLYHSDADMQKVASDVGVTIDWTVADQ